MILSTMIVIGVPVETATVLFFRIWASAGYCYQELDGCKEAMCSEGVREDIQPETDLSCHVW